MNSQPEKSASLNENNYEENKKKVISLLNEVAERRVKFEHRNQEAFIFFVSKWLGDTGRKIMHECTKSCEFYNKKLFDEKYTVCLINKNEKSKLFREGNIYGISKMLGHYGINASNHGIEVFNNIEDADSTQVQNAEITSGIRTATQRMIEARNHPPVKRLLDNIWQTNEIHFLFGDTGTGKSILAVAVSDMVSKGKRFLDLENDCEPLKVLYYDFELSDRQFRRRYSNDAGNEYSFSENFLIDNIDFAKIYISNPKGKFDDLVTV